MDEKAVIKKEEILSQTRNTLKKITFSLRGETQTREVYDRGNAATVLLYNKEKGTVILTRQFRLPSFINGNLPGMLTEACAGILDGEDAESCIRRESEEETGYRLQKVQKVLEAYSSPGALTELVHYFVAPYRDEDKVQEGGGLKEEHEHIDILELPFQQAISMVNNGGIRDAKTIILLQYAVINRLLD